MRLGRRTEERLIRHAILSYLAEHPNAQDTFEGILNWWLLDQEIKRHASIVKKALTELVTKGFIVERHGRDSVTHYRMNKQRHWEIKELSKQKSR